MSVDGSEYHACQFTLLNKEGLVVVGKHSVASVNYQAASPPRGILFIITQQVAQMPGSPSKGFSGSLLLAIVA